MLGANGGLIGGTRTASALGSGVGLWTPNEQAALRRNRSWPLSGDPFYSYTSLLLSMDGANNSTTFTDSSPYGLTVTANGDAKISTAQSKFGGASAAFDGAGDFLQLAGQSVFSFGTGDFTIELWAYFNNFTNAVNLYESRQSVEASRPGIVVGTNASVSYYNGSSFAISSNSGVLATGQWFHIAVARSSANTRLFLNGSQVGSTYSDTLNYGIGANRPVIGTYDGTGGTMNGYIDELRITKGVARYTANFTPPTQAHLTYGGYNDPYFVATSLLLHMDGANNSTTFTDSSLNALTVTANGDAKISTAWYRFGVSSAYFDGTGDYLSSSSSQLFTIGTGDFTIEAWIYPQDVSAAAKVICALRLEPPSTPIHYGPALAIEAGKLGFSNGTAWTLGGTSLTANRVYHVAVTRQNGIMNLFLDGTPDRAAWTDASDYAGSRTMTVGAASAAAYFNGYIDDLRITKGVARYTANFTPPTAPFPNA